MVLQRIQFIVNATNHTKPTESAPSKQRLARSHAARSAHAKARRQRTLQYQAEKRVKHQQDESSPGSESPETNPQPITFLPADRRDPFMSAARKLQPKEEMLFDHYVTIILPLMRCNELPAQFSQRMKGIWVPRARSEANLLNIIFLLSCRHLSASYQEYEKRDSFMQMAFRYKLVCLQSLQDAISTEFSDLSDSTIAQVIMLAYDELFVGDVMMFRHHVDGATRMTGLRGGPQNLGLDGLLEHLLLNLISKRGIEFGSPTEEISDGTT